MKPWYCPAAGGPGTETEILFEAPGARVKLAELTVGTATPSIEWITTENVSDEAPTLVIDTLSEIPAAAAEVSFAPTKELDPPVETLMGTKLTVAGTAVRPAWSDPKRSSLPAPAN